MENPNFFVVCSEKLW